jgi:hypothetical protein
MYDIILARLPACVLCNYSTNSQRASDASHPEVLLINIPNWLINFNFC